MTRDSFKDVLFSRSPKNGRFYAVAIDGRGGAGKSSFAQYLERLLPGFVFLNFDDYFEPKKNSVDWGHLNKSRFRKDVVEPLQKTNTFIYRPYDWHKTSHITEKIINVKKGLCVEGCFSFSFELDWDLKIWIETPADLCLKRGLVRDNMEKVRVTKVWRDIWQPQEDEYIKRLHPLHAADIIIDGTKPFENQLS